MPKKSMPCSFRSLTCITLQVRSGFFSTCQAHTRDEFPKMKVFLPQRWSSHHAVYVHQKKWLSIFTFIDGFPPSKLIVFCISPPGLCAVSTKKKRADSFHYEEQVSPVQGTCLPLRHSDLIPFPFFILINVTELGSYIISDRALRFYFGNSTSPSALSRLF